MKSAFINLCLPDWQQEFLKTGINEHSSSWDETPFKAEAMEQAQNAIAEATSNTKENKRERKELACRPGTADPHHVRCLGCRKVVHHGETAKTIYEKPMSVVMIAFADQKSLGTTKFKSNSVL
jgi:hypothetical protein